MEHELKELQKYLLSESSEKAIDHLVFPLFQKLFGNKFKKETDALDSDIYIEGQLIVELKTKHEDWLNGFYQALHYGKLGLSFSTICVIAHKFIAVWKIEKIPDFAKKLAAEANAQKSASEMGRTNANKTTKAQARDIMSKSFFSVVPVDIEGFYRKDNVLTELREFLTVLKNLEKDRVPILPHNFIEKIKLLKKFFDDRMDAIHCFYAIVGYWSVTSTIATKPDETIYLVDNKTGKSSEDIKIKPRYNEEFKKFVEGHYIFTNEGSGMTADYYFSRFDEVLAEIKPEYAKQHGIFFTDNNLSKFALWFVHEYYEKKLSDKYIVLDPAGGSGNLVTSWRGHLKHKIVSELEPDLLKTIERRMSLDPEHVQAGYTIVPKVSEGKGLNFLDKSAEEYLGYLIKELNDKHLKLDKPIAFLLNPPYKNTDENEDKRQNVEADYQIHKTIIELTGNDAGNERYLAFLGQIVNIARAQMGNLPLYQVEMGDILLPASLDTKKVETPLLMIFTPSSWLIPRPTYAPFRKIFDKYFKYEMGFIITGNEFFKIKGRFPIAFTIWNYNYNEKGNKNKVLVRDLTHLTSNDFKYFNWNTSLEKINTKIMPLIKDSKYVKFDTSRGDIRMLLPKIEGKTGEKVIQPRYDFSYAKKESDYRKLVSGFPLKDRENHYILKRKCGEPNGEFIGFQDDNTPVRLKQDNFKRISNKPDRVWFRLDLDFKGTNKTKLFNGPPDNRAYAAYDHKSAVALFTWFALTKALNGVYPVWANQFDIWPPNISPDKEKYCNYSAIEGKNQHTTAAG